MSVIFRDIASEQDGRLSDNSRYMGTNYMLTHKSDFEIGRTSDFTLKVKFNRDLYDMDGNKVMGKDDASEQLALSIRDYTGPEMTIEPITVRTGNGQMIYAGAPSVSNSPITFNDYIGNMTEHILLAWFVMGYNPKNEKIGFKEYYGQDAILYKWAPNGTRQISWKIMGAWLSQYTQGQYSKISPEQRLFSTTILYDRAIPFATPDYSAWRVTDTNQQTSDAYNKVSAINYLGTQGQSTIN